MGHRIFIEIFLFFNYDWFVCFVLVYIFLGIIQRSQGLIQQSQLETFAPTMMNSMGVVGSSFPVHELNRSGLSNNQQLLLYTRQESVDLWETLTTVEASEIKFNNFRLQGPPGVGKSTLLFGWMMFISQSQQKNVIWFHKSMTKINVVMVIDNVWRSGVFKGSCSDYVQELNCVFDIVIFDAFREDLMGLMTDALDGNHKFVISCTSYGNTRVNSELAAFYGFKSAYTLYSWEKDDYIAAIKCGIIIADVNDRTQPYLDEYGELTQECSELLDHKFYFGGLSFRLMQMSLDTLIGLLKDWEDAIQDKSVLLNGLQGHLTPATVHSLMGLRKGFSESCLVSQFVTKQLSKRVDLNFVTAARSVMPDNPSWQGWVFELEILVNVRRSVGKEIIVQNNSIDANNSIKLTISGIKRFLKNDGVRVFENNKVYIPDLWCNPCFDFVHFRKGEENGEPHYYFTFFNVTKAAAHSFNFEHLSNFLQPAYPLPSGRNITHKNIDIVFVVLVPSRSHTCVCDVGNIEYAKNFDNKLEGISMIGVMEFA